MLVKEWMSRPAVTISPDASMWTARKKMNSDSISVLPVIEEGKLKGMLTDRDLARAEASDATSLSVHELTYLLDKVKVRNIMHTNPVTIDFDATLSEAANTFLESNAYALPVMSGEGTLMGILTRSDLGRAFLTLTSFGRRGIQIGLTIGNRPGAVLGIIAAVGKAGARLASLISTDGHDQSFRNVFLHIYQVDRDKLPRLIDQFRLKGTLLYTADLKTGERKIFNQN